MNRCKLTECLGKPRCARCLSQDSPDELTRLRTENTTLRATLKQAREALRGMLALDEDNHQRGLGDEDVCLEVRDAYAALRAIEKVQP